MNLLIKFPTRSRPSKFFEVLDLYYKMITNIDKTMFVISCDTDDASMNNQQVIGKLNSYKNLSYKFGNNKSKIQAVNADMPESGWDIVLLASDDMIPQIQGYDEIIRESMTNIYPDTDGVLWFFDGYRRDLNTLSIMGKKYYDRFGYIYHPAYFSLWCDNEFQEVAASLNKQTFVDKLIIKHCHPGWGYGGHDPLFHRNNTLERDMVIFKDRKSKNFPK